MRKWICSTCEYEDQISQQTGMRSRSSMCVVFNTEMGIYRDNLSAIVIGDNFLSIIVIAQNSLDLSITVIAFVIYFVIADKLSR